MVSDLRHGLRVLIRTPLFTVCTIAALAVGIGSTTALFSVVHASMALSETVARECRTDGRSA